MTLLPSTRLSPCPSCAELVHAGTRRCPHCAKDLFEGAGMMCSAMLLSLALSGCMISAVYGVPTSSDTISGGSTSGATDTEGESTGGESTGSESEGTTMAPTTGGTTGTGTDATTTGGTTGTSGATEGTGTSGTSDQPLYGVVDPA